ncbi:zinc finger CCCH domain-containing protein 54-like isoform X2 [Phragmites australis]|uniref:zinc finger CCCH domain-containing protein 54-like isoform X2 n=1 Tax=Phragmites australis TaxID=29695 RepID=UPI002D779C06|nr:zinc finger CCCH domain-containing protein 54-like isoform X2 [Phragmites australis]
MDFPELAKLAFSRVQNVEPDNVGKILGCILLREPDEDEMVQLAYGTEAALLARINDAKATLAAIYARCSVQHHHQIGADRGAAAAGYHPVGRMRHFSPAAAAFGFHVQSQYWPDSAPVPAAPKAQQDFAQHVLVDAAAAAEGHYALQNQNGLEDHHYDAVGGYYYATAEDGFHNGSAGGGLPVRDAGRRPNGLSMRRPCHYFFKGICKNGQNCHYSHHQVYSDGLADEHHHNNGTTPGSLETLEMEITELLNSRRGQPVSIASLPTLYGEKYGKGLQADGYLTESQRHGKAGYSLTKLLSRLNKIRVIERPHGQHSVVLTEDAARYTELRGERGGDMGSAPASSHQIYLTFPAESIFTEEDVANYFGQYGPVRDVRIPCQERRMFGFVSFQNPETVSTILMRRNPHFICGSRVLVKPYREKSKCIESYPRPYVDKVKPMHYYPTRFFEIDPEFYPGEYESSSSIMRKQLAEKRERLIELERKRLAGTRLESVPPQFAYFDCSIEDVNPLNSLPADSKDVDLMDHPLMTPDPLEVVSTGQAPQRQASNNYDEQERSKG